MKDERSKKLFDAITEVDGELVEESLADKPRRRTRPWVKWAALAACLVIAAVGVIKLWPGREAAQEPLQKPGTQQEKEQEPEYLGPSDPALETDAYLLAAVQYPVTVPYPGENGDSEAWEAWRASRQAQMEQSAGCGDALEGYFTAGTAQFLSGAGTENRVCSPLNVYMALAMLAEITDGNSRQQILDLLGADSIDDLRDQAHALWNACYRDDGIVTTLLYNSLWLRDDMGYVPETVEALAEQYYAYTFRGQMGSDDYNELLRAWLNSGTGGLLDDYIGDVALSPETVLALASTIYYRAGWDDEFFAGGTSPDVFHAPDGDVERDFMHQTREGTVYFGDGFTAVAKHMREDGWMWLILPDEGTSIDAVLAGEMMPFLLDCGKGASQGSYTVHLSLPKFDVSSDLDLTDGLKALGVTDVFDDDTADFSPIIDARGVCVGKTEHAARVTVDEEGVEAAAYTVMPAPGAAEPGNAPEDYFFTLDRPFLFAVTGADGLPLFTGVVNQP